MKDFKFNIFGEEYKVSFKDSVDFDGCDFVWGTSDAVYKQLEIAENYPNIRLLYDVNVEELSNIKDIGPILANSIYNYFQNDENKKVIEDLIDIGVNVDYLGSTKKFSNKVTGKKIVITGTLSVASRPFIKEVLESYGAIVVESVSKKTDLVFAGENPGSKYDKAKELKIKILNDEEVTNLMNELNG